MAVSGIVFEKHRDIGQKTPIFHTILPINLHDHIELHFPQKNNTNCPSPYRLLDGAHILTNSSAF